MSTVPSAMPYATSPCRTGDNAAVDEQAQNPVAVALLRRVGLGRAGRVRVGFGSDRVSELGERGGDTTIWISIDTEFVVPSTHVLHQRVAAHDHPGGVVAFEATHWAEPCREPAVVALNAVVRILGTMLWNAAGTSSSIAARNAGARSVTTSAGAPCARSAVVKNRRAARMSRRAETYTSMIWPCWSTAR